MLRGGSSQLGKKTEWTNFSPRNTISSLASNVRISALSSSHGSVSRSLCVHSLLVPITSDNGQMHVNGAETRIATCSCHTVGVSQALLSPVRAYIHVLRAGCYGEVRCEVLSVNYTAILKTTCPISHKAGEIAFKARAYFKQEGGDGGLLYDVAKRVRMDSERMRREKKLSYNVTGNVEFRLSSKVCNRRKLLRARKHDQSRRRGVQYCRTRGIFVHKINRHVRHS